MQKSLHHVVDHVAAAAPGFLQRLRERARQHRTLALALLLVAVAAAFWSWRTLRGPEVTAVSPAVGTAVEIVYATGAVEPVRWAKVTSLIRDRIVEICDCEGKAVTKGDVLARLDDKEQTARSCTSCGRARNSPSGSLSASRHADRARRGHHPGATSASPWTCARSRRCILVQMEKLADYTIIAPMDGVVLRRDGEVGEIAEAGPDPVPRRRAQAAAGGRRGQRGGHPARRGRPDRAVAHRRVPRPAARGQGARDHTDGRSDRQDLPHPASRCPTTRCCMSA